MISLKSLKSLIQTEEFLNKFPEIKRLKDNFEFNESHNETTFEHTMLISEELQKLESGCKNKNNKICDFLNFKMDKNNKADLLYLIIVMHDLGKPDTLDKDGEITKFPGHETKSVEISKKIIDKFDLSEIEKQYILKMIKNHSLPHEAFDNPESPEEGFKNIEKNFPDIYYDLALMGMLDTMGSKLKINNLVVYKLRMEIYNKILN